MLADFQHSMNGVNAAGQPLTIDALHLARAQITDEICVETVKSDAALTLTAVSRLVNETGWLCHDSM
jgi:hypothetical protein